MKTIEAVWATLYAAALSVWAFPALALAQASQGTQPNSAPSAANPGAGTGNAGASSGGAGWLWIIAALVVLAIIWWAMSSRRRHGTVAR